MRNITRKLPLFSGLLLLLVNTAMAAPIFTPESQPTGWISRPVVSLFDLSNGGEKYYQVDFHKDTWAGDVLARDINQYARIQDTGPWDPGTAASILDSLNYSSDRKIATLGGPFRWANMTLAEQTALGSQGVLDFIRGDRSNEEPDGLSLYKREHVLNDILHSNLYFWDDGVNQTLFVGANDGMLHVFDANTGTENFAYIPSMVIPRLSLLSNKNYVHSYFVDGPISIARMDLSGTPTTVLVGSLGSGGTGLFALDVTDPTAASESDAASKVLWEITSTGSFANLGHVYGTPQLARLNNGDPAVIIGNGYVNPGNGHAVLYVINAGTGALISAIDTGSGSSASPNGLSSPTLFDENDDGKPEYAYAGDIDGHMWKFDLTNFTSSLLWTTSPARAITTAPAVQIHPSGGQMVNFATGRILTSGDYLDGSTQYAYGIWDGAPDGNTTLVTQTLTPSTVSGTSVRTVSDNAVNWASAKGWIVALPAGERVVGEKPFYNAGRFYFLSTNPTESGGENWINELGYLTGGSPPQVIFDLDRDGIFLMDPDDLAANGSIPVAKFLGPGIFSQPLLVHANGLATTLYAYHPDLPIIDQVPTEPDDPGVSGGHFDFDIYYYGNVTTVSTPTNDSQTDTICLKTKDIQGEYNKVATEACVNNPDIDPGYTFLSAYTTGAKCGAKDKDNYQQVVCNTATTRVLSREDYNNDKHVHEYDDKYDVTGVNMLNASVTDFNLPNAIVDPSQEFKILVMNQYLNPAAKLSVGGLTYENVKTYGGLASQTDAATLIGSLPVYSRQTISTLIYNLPLDAFKSKDWWGDGGAIRAGLIPTQTGCVNKVLTSGAMENDVTGESGKGKGLLGPQGERFDGALTIQIIDSETPAEALELNVTGDVRYGWRVKQSSFQQYVLAEYTSFWHHPNKICYGDDRWVPDPPEDFEGNASPETAAPGSADPKDGIFGGGLAFDTVVTVNGNVTTTTTTYSDGSEYIKTVTKNDNGSTTIHQIFRDGTEETVTIGNGDGGRAGFVDPDNGPNCPGPNCGSGIEQLPGIWSGRQTWQELY